MGRALKLTVIAEGVETMAQRDLLQRLLCDQYQGFLCAPGVPSEDLDRVIAEATGRLAVESARMVQEGDERNKVSAEATGPAS